jgi:hypothetical protein
MFIYLHSYSSYVDHTGEVLLSIGIQISNQQAGQVYPKANCSPHRPPFYARAGDAWRHPSLRSTRQSQSEYLDRQFLDMLRDIYDSHYSATIPTADQSDIAFLDPARV